MKFSSFYRDVNSCRLLYKYSKGDRFSKILSAQQEMQRYSEEVRPQFLEKIEAAREKRRALVAFCESRGLKIAQKVSEEAIDDVEKKDQEGRLIESSFIVEV